MGTNERSEDDADEAPELIRPEDFLPRNRFPDDARRLGLDDRWIGAELGFVSNLDSTKPGHRLLAVVLLVCFLVPVAMTLLFVLR